MDIAFIKTGARGYVSRVHRDDGVVLQIRGPDAKFIPPHDLGHYLVERVYAPVYGFWGMIAAGALIGGAEIVAGRRLPHQATRTKEVLEEAKRAHASSEGLVIAFQQITDGGLDRDWGAAQSVLNACLDYRTTSRPHSLQEVQAICTSFRDAAAQWSALRTGGSLRVSWETKSTTSRRERRGTR